MDRRPVATHTGGVSSDDGSLHYETRVGVPVGIEGDDRLAVDMIRWDDIDTEHHALVLGEQYVFVADTRMTPQDARALAQYLTMAADAVDQDDIDAGEA